MSELPQFAYHCTTPRKLSRYEATGCILSPVFFWPSEAIAHAWAKAKQRTVVLKFSWPKSWFPLPHPRHAYWTNNNVDAWEKLGG